MSNILAELRNVKERKRVIIINDPYPQNSREYSDTLLILSHSKYLLGGTLTPSDVPTSEIVIRLPIYLYDHSGISLSTFKKDNWDSSYVGSMYMLKDQYKDFKTKEEATTFMLTELSEYNLYLEGSCYCIQHENFDLDSLEWIFDEEKGDICFLGDYEDYLPDESDDWIKITH